jgi:hypothetical protein
VSDAAGRGPLAVATPRARIDRRPAEPAPDIGLFDPRSWSAGWQRNENAVDTGVNRVRVANEIAEQVRTRLARHGNRVDWTPITPGRLWMKGTVLEGMDVALDGSDLDNRAFFRALADARARFPQAFADDAELGDEDGLLARAGRVNAERLAQAEAVQGRLTRPGQVASFLGEVGASWNDTATGIGLLFAPLGGGVGAGRTLLAGRRTPRSSSCWPRRGRPTRPRPTRSSARGSRRVSWTGCSSTCSASSTGWPACSPNGRSCSTGCWVGCVRSAGRSGWRRARRRCWRRAATRSIAVRPTRRRRKATRRST